MKYSAFVQNSWRVWVVCMYVHKSAWISLWIRVNSVFVSVWVNIIIHSMIFFLNMNEAPYARASWYNIIWLIFSHIHWMPLEISGLLTAIITNLKFGLLFYGVWDPYSPSIWSVGNKGVKIIGILLLVFSVELSFFLNTQHAYILIRW